MHKIFLTSVIAIAMALPASANIASDANSAECDSATLGVETGTTKLEAQWNANTITLNWYDGDDKLTPANSGAAQCTYDGGITMPGNTISRTGYTFDGWTVRVAAAVCNNLSCLDVSIPRISTAYKVRRVAGANLDECAYFNYDTHNNTANCSDSVFSDLAYGEWKTGFSYGTIKGTSVCKNGYNFGTSVSGTYTRIATPEQINAASSGGYCWCRITKFNDNDVSPLWLYSGGAYTYGNNPSGTCNEYCAGNCQSATGGDGDLLLAVMFGQEIKGVADCSSITSSSECARSYPTTGYRKSYSQGCIWSNGACYNQQVSSCAAITDKRRCGLSAESSSYYCTWAGDDHCESYWDD